MYLVFHIDKQYQEEREEQKIILNRLKTNIGMLTKMMTHRMTKKEKCSVNFKKEGNSHQEDTKVKQPETF